MKKRSGASSTNEPPDPLVLFVDRSLGNKVVAGALRLLLLSARDLQEAGSGIPTTIIAERYKAGESVDELADDYGRKRLEIEEAIRCELDERAA